MEKMNLIPRLSLLLLLMGSLAVMAGARPYLVLFGSRNCEDCAQIKAEWSARKNAGKGGGAPVMFYVDIDTVENYRLFRKVERALPDQPRASVFPVVLAGRTLAAGVTGFAEVQSQLPEILAETPPDKPPFDDFGRAAAACDGMETLVNWPVELPEKEQTAAPADSASDLETNTRIPKGAASVVRLLYLSTPGCKKCARQERELTALREVYPALAVDRYDVTTAEGQAVRQAVLRHFQLPAGDERSFSPAVIWQNGYIEGRAATADELQAALAAMPAEGRETAFWQQTAVPEGEKAAQGWRGILSHATWVTMLGAGIVDGVNPCAFATVIFLISYLLYLKRGRRYVLAAGLCFCAGVFAAYLLFGVGISFLVVQLNRFAAVRMAAYALFGIVAAVLCLLHVRDAVRYRRSGQVSQMDMGLNAGTHRKIHERIRRWSRLSGALAFPAAIVLGMVISSLELVCTGQIYLPVLMAVNAAGFNLRAFALLLLYNLAFIAPLVAVTLVAFWGAGTAAVARWARDHVYGTKLVMAGVFLLIAVLMVLLAAAG